MKMHVSNMNTHVTYLRLAAVNTGCRLWTHRRTNLGLQTVKWWFL